MSDIILKTENLKKSFKIGESEQVVIDNLNIEIFSGDFTIVMGPSGSGKSTLLYALSGMNDVDGGSIYYSNNNVDITKLTNDELASFRKKNCGFVFQDKCLISGLDMLDNVLISGLLNTNDKTKLTRKTKELFAKVDIPNEFLKKLPHELSGGMAQRVSIVRALINDPTIVFADEPTGSLNSLSSTKVLDIFNEINANGQSIIMVTHDLKSACRGNRILYLKDGKIVNEIRLEKYKPDDTRRIEILNEFLNKLGW